MATTHEVLGFLIPNGGYVAVGENYEGITFLECESITKEQFEAGFAQYDAWKLEQETKVVAAREAVQARLTALGLTPDDLKALGLGTN
jgi:hypothetical protein